MKIARLTLTAVLTATLALGVTGCEDTYKTKCEDAGGKVHTEREKKTRTKTVNGKKKTETYYDTERECKAPDGSEPIGDE